MEIIKHQLSDHTFYYPNWEIKYLLIGTFNPNGGDIVNYYYGRAKNQTWKIISELFDVEFDPNSSNFLKLLKTHKIACVDMIDEVSAPKDRIERIIGKGYKDAEIINNSVSRNYNTNKIIEIINSNNNVKVFSTWGKGSALSEWEEEIQKLGEIIQLASPSLAARVPKGTNKFEFMLKDWKSKLIGNTKAV
jgi:hypothetical protein